MQLSNLPKINTRASKRLGRGLGSGRGKTAGRGTKGQKSRSGHNIPRRFEGGQTPWIQRLPKQKGFRSLKVKPQIVKISIVEKTLKAGSKVTPKILLASGLIKTDKIPTKILLDKKPQVSFKFTGVILTKKSIKKTAPTSDESESRPESVGKEKVSKPVLAK